jgi:hypothetical protein
MAIDSDRKRIEVVVAAGVAVDRAPIDAEAGLRRRPGGRLRAATVDGHIRRTIEPSAHSQRSGGNVKRRSLCSPSGAGNERPGCEVVCPLLPERSTADLPALPLG